MSLLLYILTIMEFYVESNKGEVLLQVSNKLNIMNDQMTMITDIRQTERLYTSMYTNNVVSFFELWCWICPFSQVQ